PQLTNNMVSKAKAGWSEWQAPSSAGSSNFFNPSITIRELGLNPIGLGPSSGAVLPIDLIPTPSVYAAEGSRGSPFTTGRFFSEGALNQQFRQVLGRNEVTMVTT